MAGLFASRLGLSGVGRECLQAGRALSRAPAVSLVVIATLALGFGLNTAIFSVVHGVLFRPLPFSEPDRVVFVEGAPADGAPNLFSTSYLDFYDLREANRTMTDMATTAYWTFTVTGTDVPLRLVGTRVSGTFFPLLGRPPHLGRWIQPADDAPGADEVAVLTHGLWQRMFGADPSVIGRVLMMNGVRTEVIGVMPEGFRFPAEDSDLWVAMRDELSTVGRGSRFFVTLGRLRDGMSVEAAAADLGAVVEGLRAEYPDAYSDWQPAVSPALPRLTNTARPRLWLLFTAVVVVLLVACVNVASLIAARGSARAREFAVRAALGAGMWRLARVTFLESLWLGVAGLSAGLLLAVPTVAWLRSLAPADLPRMDGVTLSGPVMGWAACAMAVFVVIGAAAPLARARRVRVSAMRATTVAGASGLLARRLLVVSQVAGAFVLLVAAGLLIRSFERVLDVNPGFEPANAAVMRVFLTPPTYRSMESQKQFVGRGIDTLRSTPGVVAAAAVSQSPFDTEGAGTRLSIALEGESYAPGANPNVRYRTASGGYFDAIGMTILRGRGIGPDDREGAPLVLVVNASMAAEHWPGEDPIGKRLEFADGRDVGWHTVVGVVNDVATDGLESAEGPTVYAPYEQRSLTFLRWMTFVVRTERDVATALPSIRASLQSLDPDQPIYAVSTMDAVVARSVAERRFSLMLMAGFGALTLLLAAIGLYGALAQSVSLRTRDIGVRLAIGAEPASMFRMVVLEGLRVVAAGLMVGLALATFAARQVENLLFGVTPLDPATYVAIAVILCGVGLVACVIPGMRASWVDPVTALRAE